MQQPEFKKIKSHINLESTYLVLFIDQNVWFVHVFHPHLLLIEVPYTLLHLHISLFCFVFHWIQMLYIFFFTVVLTLLSFFFSCSFFHLLQFALVCYISLCYNSYSCPSFYYTMFCSTLLASPMLLNYASLYFPSCLYACLVVVRASMTTFTNLLNLKKSSLFFSFVCLFVCVFCSSIFVCSYFIFLLY